MQNFIMFMESVVLPRKAANPDYVRLDGAISGGDREVAGEFHHQDCDWVIPTRTMNHFQLHMMPRRQVKIRS